MRSLDVRHHSRKVLKSLKSLVRNLVNFSFLESVRTFRSFFSYYELRSLAKSTLHIESAENRRVLLSGQQSTADSERKTEQIYFISINHLSLLQKIYILRIKST